MSNPRWVAERVGIEQIGYLTKLKSPQPTLTLVQAGQVYADFAKVSHDEHGRVRRIWAEFVGIANVTAVKDIDYGIAEHYERAIWA